MVNLYFVYFTTIEEINGTFSMSPGERVHLLGTRTSRQAEPRVAGIGSTTDAPSGQLRAVVVGEVCSYCHPLDPEPTQTYCKYRSDNDAWLRAYNVSWQMVPYYYCRVIISTLALQHLPETIWSLIFWVVQDVRDPQGPVVMCPLLHLFHSEWASWGCHHHKICSRELLCF